MEDIQKAIQAAIAERRKHIADSFSNSAEIREQEEAEERIRKAAEEEETSEEEVVEEEETEEEGENTEKSDISYALNFGNIKVAKTGKEIKDQVDSVIIPELTSKLAVQETTATEKLKDCGNAPTHEPDDYWTGDVKMDVGYNVYNWEEMRWCPEDGRLYDTFSASDEAEKKGNCATSEAEALARREYNEAVRAICNIKVDIRACGILKELKDGVQYELTPKQVLALKF